MYKIKAQGSFPLGQKGIYTPSTNIKSPREFPLGPKISVMYKRNIGPRGQPLEPKVSVMHKRVMGPRGQPLECFLVPKKEIALQS